jgi:uncharacterized protein
MDFSTLAPVRKERIELLDIFRGFAVYGIFVVNIEAMNCTWANQGGFYDQFTSFFEKAVMHSHHLFFYSKFFPIFSLLFGIGLTLQVMKIKDKSSVGFFFRRMGALFLFGILHIVFLWGGDILHLYAVLGIATLFFIDRSNKLLIGLSLLFLLFPFYDQLSSWIFEVLSFNPEMFIQKYKPEEISALIKTGSYWKGAIFRLEEYVSLIPMVGFYILPMVFAMFLLGMVLCKKGVVFDLVGFANKVKVPAIAIGLITNVYRLTFIFILVGTDVYKEYREVFIKIMMVSDMAMSLFYLWLIAWIFQFVFWQKLLSPLKYAGKMALTNYIMHSVFNILIFSSVGLQLYQFFSPAGTLLLATAIFAFQVIFSKIWLSYFYFGPLEWVWRCITYWKILPIKRKQGTQELVEVKV